MTPRDEAQTRIKQVQNFLGIPDEDNLFPLPADHLTDAERQNRLLYAMYRDQQEVRVYGCEKGKEHTRDIAILRRWQSWVIGGLAGVAALMAFLVFLEIVLKGKTQ